MNPKTNLPEGNLSNNAIKSKTFAGIAMLIVALGFAFGLGIYVKNGQKEIGMATPLRKVLDRTKYLNRAIVGNTTLAETYPVGLAVKKPKVNGGYGMDLNFKPDTLRVSVEGYKNDINLFSKPDSLLKGLPVQQLVFNFKCVEGWNQITWWSGVRFSDFVRKHHLVDSTKALPAYVGMETPDFEYYVGLDYASMMHPQTLLVTHMNGKPLPLNQGAPMRLIIPIKYGVKSIKRIGGIWFSDTKPADYWHQKGYDYDLAL